MTACPPGNAAQAVFWPWGGAGWKLSLCGNTCPVGAGDGPGSLKEQFGVSSMTHEIQQIYPKGRERRCLSCFVTLQVLPWRLVAHRD